MAETLGALCDKLTIVILKQWHTEDLQKLSSLRMQANNLQHEIDEYLFKAITGEIPRDHLTFDANKVYKQDSVKMRDFLESGIGGTFSTLAEINCSLWHEQEKVYMFSEIPVEEKDSVVNKLATLNIERNRCIDHIDKLFASALQSSQLSNV